MSEEIIKSEYSDVMQKSYIDYAMSVICARAVPDVRDGLKPVQRRVLYAMSELGLRADRPHRKSARIVGDTMGKYHPHGDSSIYETLVVLSQEFKKEMPLVDGHGNFGSMEGDSAAAMRYTEARLEEFAQNVYLADLDKGVVDFVPNFDETEREPEVLPVRIPNVLVNGSEGIAVGMTTNIPTHNLGEVVDAMIAYMKKNSITTAELMEYLPGPDFPTGGLVVNKSELLDIYEEGTGRMKLRGKVVLEEAKRKSDRDKLVITEIPYTMVGANIGKFILDICDLVETKTTTDIVDISNESDREGIRIVLELKKGADPVRIENMLYKKTRLEDTFGVNMLVISGGRPEVMGLKDILKACVDFQYEINTRKYSTLLAKDREQQEIKEGLIRACDIIDLIIEIIRGSQSVSQAKSCLVEGDTSQVKFKSKESEKAASELRFTENQAQAILDLRLAKLIGLEIIKLKEEYEELIKEIAEYENILSDRSVMKKVIIKDLERIKKEYATPRKTRIIDGAAAVFEEEEVKEQEVVFLMDRFGYSKTVEPAAYERNIQAIEEENEYIIRCMNTDNICIFTHTGTMHQVKVLKVPMKKPKDKGVPIDNLCNYTSDTENIIQVIPMSALRMSFLLFTTKGGMMKFVDASEFEVVKRTVAATKLEDGDEVVSIDVFDASDRNIYSAGSFDSDEIHGSPMISGGSEVSEPQEDGISPYLDPDDDQLTFEFFDLAGGGSEQVSMSMTGDETSLSGGAGQGVTGRGGTGQKSAFKTNKMVVLQTKEGVFLRFKLNEVPERKKGAVGVRGIKLNPGDEIDKVHIVGFGDKDTVVLRDKEIELMKIKLAKRDTKGTKPRL
ncbi:MAG: DNA gyrase/topoisomerase IV subunit A [Lachnospiraceae bacterium]|jgi:DNA gyrase subunit A